MSKQLRNYFIQKHVERQQQEQVRQVVNHDLSDVVNELEQKGLPTSEMRLKRGEDMVYVVGIETDDYREAGRILTRLQDKKHDTFTVTKEEVPVPIQDNVNQDSVYQTLRAKTPNSSINVQLHDSLIFESNLLYLVETTGINNVYTEPKKLFFER